MYELYLMNRKYSIILLKGARTYQRRMPARNHQICKNKLCCFFAQNCSVKIDDMCRIGQMRRSMANTNRFKATDYINTTELHIYDVQVSNYAELDLLVDKQRYKDDVCPLLDDQRSKVRLIWKMHTLYVTNAKDLISKELRESERAREREMCRQKEKERKRERERERERICRWRMER